MVPILIAAVAAQAVSGLMQYYQQEKANGATRARLKEIEAMFNSIVPPDFDLKVYDDPRLAADIPAPMLNTEAITPELYQSVGQYVPEVASFVEETRPELVQATQAAKEGRTTQLEALERYKQIASGEFDPELQQKLSDASRRANMDAQSRTASILQDANRRGQANSGITLALQNDAAAQAMDRASQQSLLAAAEGYRNQLSALDKSAALGGDIRQSEMAEQAKNVDILNRFNERASKNYQDFLTTRADALNKAKILNLDREQKLANANVELRNKAKTDARDLQNDQQKLNYDAAWKNRNNALDVEERKARLKQQMYENMLAKVRGKAGIAQTGIDYMNKAAQDRNATIRGVGDAVTAGALYYGANPGEKKDNLPEKSKPQYGESWTGRDYPYDYPDNPDDDPRYLPA